jgi:hypothetical protein
MAQEALATLEVSKAISVNGTAHGQNMQGEKLLTAHMCVVYQNAPHFRLQFGSAGLLSHDSQA